MQGYAGELPTWQKACGLITHGSQGAKNKHDQEANRERERQEGDRGEEGRGWGLLTRLGRVPGASVAGVAPVDRMT